MYDPEAEDRVLRLAQLYEARPDFFSPEHAELLRSKVGELGYYLPKPDEGDFSVLRTFQDAFKGLASGLTFSGLPGLEAPSPYSHWANQLAYNLGHLIGFIGIIVPTGGAGAVGKAGSKVAAELGATAVAKTAARGFATFERLPSLSMAIGKAAVNYAEKRFAKSAWYASAKYLQEGTWSGSMIRSATTLGVASAINVAPPWQISLEDRLTSFGWGAAMGGAFSALGTGISRQGWNPGKYFTDDPIGMEKADRVLRTVAGAALMGLPATAEEQPWPLQVYDYMLGGIFGMSEMPAYLREVRNVQMKYTGPVGRRKLMQPETLPEYQTLSRTAQEAIVLESELMLGRMVQLPAALRERYPELGEAITEGGVVMAKAYTNAVARLVADGKLTEDQGWNLIEVADTAARVQELSKHYKERYDEISKQARADLAASSKEIEDQVAAYRKRVTEAKSSNAVRNMMAEYTLPIDNWTISNAIEEYDLPKSVQHPVDRISKELVRGTDYNAAEVAVSIVTLMGEARKRYVNTETGLADTRSATTLGWDNFMREVEKIAPVIKAEERADLRTAFLNSIYAETMPKRDYNKTKNTLDDSSETDILFSNTLEHNARGFLERLLGTRFTAIKKATSGEEGRPDANSQDIHRATTLKDAVQVISLADAEGRGIWAGVKDKHHLKSVPYVNLPDGRPISLANQEAVFSFVDSKVEALGPEAQEVFGKNLMSFLTHAGVDIQDAKHVGYWTGVYYRNVANNIRIAEIRHSEIPIEEQIKEPQNFLQTPGRLNQRVQPLVAPEIPWDIDGSLNILLVNAINKNNRTSVVGQEDLSIWQKIKGAVTKVKTDTHLDGPFVLRSDVFDQYAEFFGWNPNSGTQKGTVTHTEPGFGGFIGKLAYHRADPELDAVMKEMNIDGMMLDTAIKERGRRQVYDAEYDPGTKRFNLYREGEGSPDTAPQTYKFPKTAIKANVSTGETFYELDDQRMPIQGHSNFSLGQGGADAIKSFEDVYQKKEYEGDQSQNDLVDQYIQTARAIANSTDPVQKEALSKEAKKLANDINVDKIGMQSLMNILAGDISAAGDLFEKTMGEVFRIGQHWDEIEDVSGERMRRIIEDKISFNSLADRIVKLWGVSQGTVAWFRPYTETVIRNYMVGRLVRPKIEGSFKVMMAPYTWTMRAALKQKLGRDLQPGEMLVHDGVLVKEVPFTYEGETSKRSIGWLLGEWEKFVKDPPQDAEDKAFMKALEDSLTPTNLRVPADSVSGARNIRIVGSTGVKGVGAVYHPEDMQNLGGADLDFDTAFVMFGLPKPMRDFYEAWKDEWYESAVAPDGSNVKVFKPAKTHTELIKQFTPEENLQRNHFVSMFDPIRMWDANAGAALSNDQLGAILNHVRRLMVTQELLIKRRSNLTGYVSAGWWNRFMQDHEQELRQQGINPDEYPRNRIRWHRTPKRDSEPIRDLKRDGVGFSADAAKGDPMVPFAENSLTYTSSVYGPAVLHFPDGKRFTIQDEHAAPSIWSSYLYGALRTVDDTLRKRSVGKNYADIQRSQPLFATIKTLQDVYSRNTVLHEAPNTWFKAAELLSGLYLQDTHLAWQGENYKRLVKTVDELLKRKDPAARVLLDIIRRQNVTVAGGLKAQPRALRTIVDPETGETIRVPATGDLRVIQDPSGQEVAERYWTRKDTEELALQDISDIISVPLEYDAIMGAIGRNVSEERITEIMGDADFFKKVLTKRRLTEREAMMEARRLRKYFPTGVTKSKAYEHIRNYTKELPPGEREVFEAHMLSSLFIQEPFKNSAVGLAYKAMQEAKKEFDKLNKNPDSDPNAVVEARRVWEGYRSNYYDQRTRWFMTNKQTLTMMMDVISPSMFKKYGDLFKEFVGLTWERDLEPGARKLLRLPAKQLVESFDQVQPGLSQMNPVADIQPKAEDVAKRVAAMELVGKAKPLSEIPLEREELLQGRIKALEELMYHYPEQTIKLIDSVFPGEVGKINGFPGFGPPATGASLKDIDQFVGRFMKRGEWWYNLKETLKGIPVRRRSFFFLPDRFDETHIPFDTQTLKMTGWVVDPKGTPVEYPTRVLISSIGRHQQIMAQANFLGGAIANRIKKELDDRFRMFRVIDEEIINSAFAIAQRIREGKNPQTLYQQRMREAQAELARRANETVQVTTIQGKRTTLPFSRIVELAQQRTDTWSVDNYGGVVRDPTRDSNLLVYDKYGEVDVDASIERLITSMENGELQRRIAQTTDDEGRAVPWQKTLPFTYDAIFRLVHEMSLERLRIPQYDSNGQLIGWEVLGEIEDRARRHQAKVALTSMGYNWVNYESISTWDPTRYFPHNGFPRKTVNRHIEAAIEKAIAQRASKAQQSGILIEREININDEMNADGGVGEAIQRVLELDPITPEALEKAGVFSKPGHLKPRSVKNSEITQGWAEDVTALQTYENQLAKGFFNAIASLASYKIVKDFRKTKPLGEYSEGWAKFMIMFNRDNIGMPSTFPKEFIEDKSFWPKFNPYYVFTEQAVLDMVGRWDKIFGGKLDSFDEAVQKRAKEVILTRRLAHLSNLEAKWNLMALLAHPRFVITNIFGASVNDIILSGIKPLQNSMKFDYLKGNILPTMKSMDEIHAFVDAHGGLESYYINEFKNKGLWEPGTQMTGFIEALAKKLRKDPQFKDYSIGELAGKFGMGSKFTNAVEDIVRGSERGIRHRSWLAHYLQARKLLDIPGAYYENDHPWLVNMANRGMTAAQFLYNNAYRPAFARTSLGKVYTRFQMWAWRSTELRYNIFNDALKMGLEPGSQQFERFSRMVVADMFVLALGQAFMYSLFEYALPQPWDWLRQLGAWFFGDEKERDKAFFGQMPWPTNILQPISPPASRLVLPIIAGFMTGDWERFATYNVYTWFPMGRAVSSAVNSVKNPGRSIEYWTGLPYGNLVKEMSKQPRRPSAFHTAAGDYLQALSGTY